MAIPTASAPVDESVSYCLIDSSGQRLAAERAERPYYAASTIKLHVLLAALQAADAGSLDLDRTVPATRTFTGSDGREFTLHGDHLDPTHPPEGEAVPVRELLVRMIDRSSNEATDHAIELLGDLPGDGRETAGDPPSRGPRSAEGRPGDGCGSTGDRTVGNPRGTAARGLRAVARAVGELDLRATRVERLIGDRSALDAGATNETCASDLAATIRVLAQARRLSPRTAQVARRSLEAQRIRLIGPALRDGITVGSKSGWVDGYRHDAAFIGSPDDDGLRCLAVMTSGMPPDDADARIRETVRALLPDIAR